MKYVIQTKFIRFKFKLNLFLEIKKKMRAKIKKGKNFSLFFLHFI